MKINVRKDLMHVLPWLIPIVLLLVWQGLSSLGVLSATVLPSPLGVIRAGIRLFKSGELMNNLGISLYRAMSGFLIGGITGFVLGLCNGIFKVSDSLFDSSVQMLRNVPHLSLIPLMILWFGIGETPKIVLVALGVLFPIYINTYHGIKYVDKELVEMGQAYGLNGLSLFTHIIFPGALSSILVGVRYALGVMWTTLIVAETISSNSGIGYMAMNAREFMQMDVIVLSILIYALLGKCSDLIAKLFERRWLRWSQV
ncbi:MAG: aliphatic sulfonate ABC transporter permease SsuC [Sporolactobacillus sp.]|uniref:aliphatic sulfonate ABC transporter permease SsuC n=1 Tax=Sporolactobacillus sp. STSJ-5 TaxID=2965076 RepID=UPI002106C7D8|nr:aliphatic sulfonate ABC transporter permease SsuC [Sporolactobacillus sp. STSJ-5]MCQ2011059.1 aliphatic sulfonate ABC transporter permease SsuC [Sporolactobacillus sp. STSJ-5]